jgi:hypothetical protein
MFDHNCSKLNVIQPHVRQACCMHFVFKNMASFHAKVSYFLNETINENSDTCHCRQRRCLQRVDLESQKVYPGLTPGSAILAMWHLSLRVPICN